MAAPWRSQLSQASSACKLCCGMHSSICSLGFLGQLLSFGANTRGALARYAHIFYQALWKAQPAHSRSEVPGEMLLLEWEVPKEIFPWDELCTWCRVTYL